MKNYNLTYYQNKDFLFLYFNSNNDMKNFQKKMIKYNFKINTDLIKYNNFR